MILGRVQGQVVATRQRLVVLVVAHQLSIPEDDQVRRDCPIRERAGCPMRNTGLLRQSAPGGAGGTRFAQQAAVEGRIHDTRPV